jgi:tRNA-guanine family transglycosylase
LRDADAPCPQWSSVHIGRHHQHPQRRHQRDTGPIDPECSCSTCRAIRAPICAIWTAARRSLGVRLATLHNLHFYLNLMRRSGPRSPLGRFAQLAPRYWQQPRRPGTPVA